MATLFEYFPSNYAMNWYFKKINNVYGSQDVNTHLENKILLVKNLRIIMLISYGQFSQGKASIKIHKASFQHLISYHTPLHFS